MPANPDPHTKSVHQQAFAHYLRTGERLSNSEWLARCERKFNPYHDERGRFTSPPGVIVSWGRYRPGPTRGPTSATSGANAGAAQARKAPTRDARPAVARSQRASGAGFRSDFVRAAVSPQTSNADTYFELNKRQAYLDRLRAEAGSRPDPVVKTDLDDFQRRLDADRARLDDIKRRVVDPQTTEILRAGFAPVDTAVGAIKVARGEGELRDYLAVASVVPVGRAAKVAEGLVEPATGKVVQLGGAYWKVRRLKPRGHEFNHIPPHSVTGLRYGEGPGIAMLKEHHRKTLSFGSGEAAKAHRAIQRNLIEQGKFREAVEMDMNDIRGRHGDLYDEAFEHMPRYIERKRY